MNQVNSQESKALSQRIEATMNEVADILEATGSINENALHLLDRLWFLTQADSTVLSIYKDALVKFGDIKRLKRVFIDAAFRSLIDGKEEQAMHFFNEAHTCYAEHTISDSWEVESEIFYTVRALGENYAQHLRSAPANEFSSGEHNFAGEFKMSGGKIRLVHVCKGLLENNSILIRILKQYAKFHSKDGFEIAFAFLESPEAIPGSLQGAKSLEEFAAYGWQVLVPDKGGTPLNNCLSLASKIYQFAPDVILFSAAAANMYSYLLASMHLAPRLGVFLMGHPGIYCAPQADFGIALTRHAQIDAPFYTELVPIEHDLPTPKEDITALKLKRRLESNTRVIIIAGRPQKLRERKMWIALCALLVANPNLSLRVMGADLGSVGAFVPAELHSRLDVIAWGSDYFDKIQEGDLLIDTYPSGGGMLLLESAALGVPVVTFENNYQQLFNQLDWNPGAEMLGEVDLVVPRGDFKRLEELVQRLLDDEVALDSYGEAQQSRVRATRGDMARCVRGVEKVIQRICI